MSEVLTEGGISVKLHKTGVSFLQKVLRVYKKRKTKIERQRQRE